VDLYDLEDIKLPESFSDKMEDKPALYRRTRRVFEQLTEEEQRDALRHYLAFCTYEDHLFGQALEALEETGQAENTLVIFMSDHGDYVADHGLWCKGLPCFNGAYHVPCVMRWPAGIEAPGRTVDAMINLADFAPTFYELTGIENPLPENAPGASLLPFLRDQTPAEWRDAHFTQSNGNEIYGIQRSVMTDDWKFVYNAFDEDELYDLRDDPEQLRNLAGDPQFAGVIRDLSKRLWQFAYEQEDSCVNPYIMVGLAPHGPGVIYQE
jgi:arylsulfatase A-like enzyme